MDRPHILVLSRYTAELDQRLKASFDVHRVDDERVPWEEIRAVATSGKGHQLDTALLGRLPNLELVASYSAGIESVDTEALAARGVPITTPSALLADDVADVAFGLLLAVGRRLVVADRYVRQGKWPSGPMPLTHRVWGRRLGIVGLGAIGRAVALRAQAFSMELAYFGPRPRSDCSYVYYSQLGDLARWADVLVVSCPGGAATRHLIDAEVLKCLGPDGWLINVARGTIVDETALLNVLAADQVGGVGLDVHEYEPRVSEVLRGDDRVVLLPHIGSATFETRLAMADHLVGTLKRALASESSTRPSASNEGNIG